jgi:hypothetical protein
MPSPKTGLTSRSIGGVQTAAALPWRDRWRAVIEAERAALALWLPVAFAAGVALWFGLPWQSQRLAAAVLFAGLGLAGLLQRWRPLAIAALLALAGMAVAQARTALVAHPVLAAPRVVTLAGAVTAVTSSPRSEPLAADARAGRSGVAAAGANQPGRGAAGGAGPGCPHRPARHLAAAGGRGDPGVA